MVPTEGAQEANRQRQPAHEWAGHPANFRAYHPPQIHCHDTQIRAEALGWLDQHLRIAQRQDA